MLPDLARLASEGERATIYGLILVAGYYGWLQAFRLHLQYGPSADMPQQALSIGGIAVVVLFGLIFRILLRNAGGRKTTEGVHEHDEVLPGSATLPASEPRCRSGCCRELSNRRCADPQGLTIMMAGAGQRDHAYNEQFASRGSRDPA